MSNWPEKVYLRTNPDAFDQGLPENNDFQGTMWTWLHDKEKAYSVEYTRSDLALPGDLKAELGRVLTALDSIEVDCEGYETQESKDRREAAIKILLERLK